MKTLKRISVSLLAFVLLVSLFAGCSSGTPASTTPSSSSSAAPSASSSPSDEATSKELKADITFWSSYTESSNYGQVISQAAEAFMKENPGVKIDISFQGTDIQSTLGPALQAGTKITMFEANTDASMALWKDQMMDLTQYYNTVFPQTEGNTYEKSILGAYAALAKIQGEGTYLYFPYTPQFVSIWYNKDIFDACGITKTPTTWEELGNL